MESIYDIREEYEQLIDMAEDPTVDGQTLKDTMESIQGDFDEKVASYCHVIQTLQARVEEHKTEIARLNTNKTVIENNIKRMKDVLLNNMKALGRNSAGDDIISAKVRKNGGKLPIVYDKSVDVPEEYLKVEKTTDGTKVREALESGKELPFARLGERGETITIK